MLTLKNIIEIFSKGKIPKGAEFEETWKSFWHKSEKAPMEQIIGLNSVLASKAPKSQVDAIANQLPNLATKDDLQSVMGGLRPLGSVETEAELRAIVTPNDNDSYYVNETKDENGNPYIWRFDKNIGEHGDWVNTKQVVYKDVVKKSDLNPYLKDDEVNNISSLQGRAIVLKDESKSDNLAKDLNIKSDELVSGSIEVVKGQNCVLSKSINSIDALNSPYKFVGRKFSGNSLYTMALVNNSPSINYTLGVCLKKDQYPNGIFAHLTIYFGNENEYSYITFNSNELVKGTSKTQDKDNHSYTVTIIEDINGYIYLQYQVTATKTADKCQILPYSNGGASIGVDYEYLGLYVKNEIVDIDIKSLSKGFYSLTYDAFSKDVKGVFSQSELLEQTDHEDFVLVSRKVDNIAKDLNTQTDILVSGSTEILKGLNCALSKSINPIEALNSPYKFVGRKLSGESLYTMALVNNSPSINYTMGVCVNKDQYPNGLKAHSTLFFDGKHEVASIDFSKNELVKGTSKSINTTAYYMSVKVVESVESYIYLQYQVTATKTADKCQILPYSNGGASIGVDYEYLGLYAKNEIVDIEPLKKEGVYQMPISNISDVDMNSVKAELLLARKIKAIVGDTIQIYKDSMINLYNTQGYYIDIDASDSSGHDYNRYWEYTANAPKTITLTARLYSPNRNLSDTQVCEIEIFEAVAFTEPRIILCQGDSLTYYNRYPDEIFRSVSTDDTISVVNSTITGRPTIKLSGLNLGQLKFVGTQRKNHLGWTGQQFHEGYSGWQMSDFLKQGSPFFINGKLDFKAYFANNSLDIPSIWMIGLGWNDIGKNVYDFKDPSFIINNFRTFLTALFADFPNMKVKIWTENFPSKNGGQGNHPWGADVKVDVQLWKLKMFYLCKAYQQLEDEFENVEVILATTLRLDSENSMQEGIANVNTRLNITERRGKDDIHPDDAGFFQIADALIPYIVEQ